VIEVRGLSKRFGKVSVVDDVSFHVERGELLALVGASGSGKTTTLKMLNRLIEPSAGSVRIAGVDIANVPQHQLRRGIGYAFQQVGLFPHLTVGENIGLTPRLLGWSSQRTEARVRELLGLMGLEQDLANRQPDALSGGQAQRVGVARALAAHPDVLLLDEPFGALDPLTRDRLQRFFYDLQRRLQLTVVLVTHDMAEALLMADRIAVLQSGRLIQIASPQGLLRAPASEYVEGLMDLPRRQARVFDHLARGAARA
jgi:osmoprotectant transport system ATP-binding protein